MSGNEFGDAARHLDDMSEEEFGRVLEVSEGVFDWQARIVMLGDHILTVTQFMTELNALVATNSELLKKLNEDNGDISAAARLITNIDIMEPAFEMMAAAVKRYYRAGGELGRNTRS